MQDLKENAVNDSSVTDNADMTAKKGVSPKAIGIIKIAAPLTVIVICMVVVTLMIMNFLKNSNNIEGRFVMSSDHTSYIELDSGGDYLIKSTSSLDKGTWTLSGGRIDFVSESGAVSGARFIDRKYIVMDNYEFFSGDIPKSETFDAEVVSQAGETYCFNTDGKIYLASEGRNEEIGSYIIDGYFIIVTTSEGNITYLNCGDGITADFYQAS